MVREFNHYRISVYSPNDHFAVITGPGSNAIIDLKENQPRSTTLKAWPVPLTIVDLIWGMVLTAEARACGYAATRQFG